MASSDALHRNTRASRLKNEDARAHTAAARRLGRDRACSFQSRNELGIRAAEYIKPVRALQPANFVDDLGEAVVVGTGQTRGCRNCQRIEAIEDRADRTVTV